MPIGVWPAKHNLKTSEPGSFPRLMTPVQSRMRKLCIRPRSTCWIIFIPHQKKKTFLLPHFLQLKLSLSVCCRFQADLSTSGAHQKLRFCSSILKDGKSVIWCWTNEFQYLSPINIYKLNFFIKRQKNQDVTHKALTAFVQYFFLLQLLVLHMCSWVAPQMELRGKIKEKVRLRKASAAWQAVNDTGIFFFSVVIFAFFSVMQSAFWILAMASCNAPWEADSSLTCGSSWSLTWIPRWPDKALFSTAWCLKW